MSLTTDTRIKAQRRWLGAMHNCVAHSDRSRETDIDVLESLGLHGIDVERMRSGGVEESRFLSGTRLA